MKSLKTDVWSGERQTKITCNDNLVRNVTSSSTKRKAALGYRTAEARQCAKVERHSLIFITTDDMESKDLMKNARKKLGRLWNQPCLARFETLGKGRPVAKTNPTLTDHNTFASWNPTNLRESASERTPPKDHEDRIAGKGFNSLSHYNLLRKFIPMHQPMKIPDAKSAVDKGWEKLGKLPAWQANRTKVVLRNTENVRSANLCRSN